MSASVDMHRRALMVYGAVLWSMPFVPSAAAHDFWLEPASFRPQLGSRVPIHIYIGQDFKGDAGVYNPEWFERYVYVSGGQEQTVPGVLGDEPAGSVPVNAPGVILIGYRSRRDSVAFVTSEEFEKYLIKEGLEQVIPLQRRRKTRLPIREVYSRSAKSLIAAGNMPGAAPADKALGFRLELIAEANPYAQAAGARIPVRLLFENKPLPGVLVKAFNKAEPAKKLTARTDTDGRVSFSLPRRGVWLLTAVHMFQAPAALNADWESLWASLSFALP